MKIKELMIRKTASTLNVCWELSEGEQSSYELFLMKGGSVAERIKASDKAMRCSLKTLIEPMKEYALLLTVRSGELLTTARAGFFSSKDGELCRSLSY